jgi:hypothetical protein
MIELECAGFVTTTDWRIKKPTSSLFLRDLIKQVEEKIPCLLSIKQRMYGFSFSKVRRMKGRCSSVCTLSRPEAMDTPNYAAELKLRAKT